MKTFRMFTEDYMDSYALHRTSTGPGINMYVPTADLNLRAQKKIKGGKKNSMKDQSATLAINKFWGSPTVVATPPKAVPTAPCIKRFLRKPLKVWNSSEFSENDSSFEATLL